ncbi:hypothetical protein D3C76_684920 [compost metagenome]
MLRQRLANLGPRPADQVEHPGRQANRVDHLRQQKRMQRRFLARLDHHRATSGQRRRQLAQQLMQRVVPRVDECAHAHGLAVHQRVADFAHFIHQSGQLDVLLKPDDRPIDLHGLAPLHRHAQLGGDQIGHFRSPTLEFHRQRAQVTSAHARGRARPVIEGASRSIHRALDILLVAQRHPADGQLAGGVDHLGHALPARHLPGTVEVQPRVLTHGPAPSSARQRNGRCAGRRRSGPRHPPPGPGGYARRRWGRTLRRPTRIPLRCPADDPRTPAR